MDNKLLINGLFNKNVYDSITNKLKNFQGKECTPAGVRGELTKDVAENSSVMGNMTATIAAYYYYSLGKKELDFLTSYYHKTFSAYFNASIIKKYYNEIIRDEFLMKMVYDICDKNALSELSKYGKTISNKEKSKQPVKYSKKKTGTTKVASLDRDKYNRLILNANLAKMLGKVKQGKYKAAYSDMVATMPKVLVEKMILNINKLSEKFKPVSDLENSKIKDIKNSLSQIFFNQKLDNKRLVPVSISTIFGKPIIARAGTKLEKFPNLNKKLHNMY